MAETIDGILNKAIYDMAEKAVKTGTQLTTGGSIADIFTITGGPILVTALCGEFQADVSHACNMQLILDPVDGDNVDMCAVVDINPGDQYEWVYLTGTVADAAVIAAKGSALPLGIGMDIPFILQPGGVDMDLSNNTPTTGSIVWYMRYKPLAAGITVTGKA